MNIRDMTLKDVKEFYNKWGFYPIGGGDPITLAVVAIGVGGAVAGGIQRGKAEDKAREEARTQEAEARSRAEATTQRIEEATRPTPQELAREQRLLGVAPGEERVTLAEPGLEERRQVEAERRAGLPGEELLGEVGPQTAALLRQIEERGALTGEELFRREGEVPSALQERVLEGARAPGGTFEDTLKEQLEISRQQISAEANKRGVFGGTPEGGIRFEQLGRAGVELAIGSAREREAARQQDLANASSLATQFLNLSAAARGETAAVGEAGIAEQTQARSELDALVRNIQTLTESARGREAGGVITGQQFDIARTEPAAERKFGTFQQLTGAEIGRGERLEETGFGLLGQAAGAQITGGIPGRETIPTAAPTPSLTTLRGTSEQEFEDIFRLQRRAGRLS